MSASAKAAQSCHCVVRLMTTLSSAHFKTNTVCVQKGVPDYILFNTTYKLHSKVHTMLYYSAVIVLVFINSIIICLSL